MSIVCDVIVGDDSSIDLPFDPIAVSDYSGRVFSSCGIDSCQVNIVVIGDEAMTEINEAYRHKTGSTDVLSFNLSEPDDDILEGEIYVSLDRVRDQAAEYGVTEKDEFIRLITHGLLHLCGRTHDSDETYQQMMEETERLMTMYHMGGEEGQ